MNLLTYQSSIRTACTSTLNRARVVFVAAGLLFAIGVPIELKGQSDDFNDGNDDGWTRFGLDSAGLPPAAYSFPDDGTGGKAYRILVAAPPVPAAGPARAFAYRKDVTYTDFYVAVDIIAFDNTLNQAFGFLVRAGNIGLGLTTGYVMNYDPNQAAGGRGQFQINSISGEVPTTIAAANISLDPNRRYRFVMTGVGSILTGKVYDMTDLTTPIVTITADDGTYPSGFLGVFNFSRVNAANYTNATTGKADTTFDNFVAAVSGPTAVAAPGTPHSLPGTPQVVSRSPGSFANFYAPTNGVKFTATTLATNAINTIRLVLNDTDVSAQLAAVGSPSNLNVSFNGLSPNTLYNARIVLADFSGRTSTNEWTFDTFSEAFLSGGNAKVIEAEDYNYDGGKFQNDPPPSGIDSNSNQIRGNGAGYFGLIGTPDVDFFDRSTSPGSGLAAEYRTEDNVGTARGAVGAGNTAELAGVDLNDTRRQKYVPDDLAEYEVRRTEGDEWLNYTRQFASDNYNVFLRVGCRAAQTVSLDRVTSDPSTTGQTTAPLGVFSVPSTAMTQRYRYVPLIDASGKLAVLNLSGTNTLRLTMGGPATNVTQYTMFLNYLAFVPASAAPAPGVQLESSVVVTGPFSAESAATIDAAAKTVTVPRTGESRFYRLRADVPYHFKSISITAGNVVMIYE